MYMYSMYVNIIRKCILYMYSVCLNVNYKKVYTVQYMYSVYVYAHYKKVYTVYSMYSIRICTYTYMYIIRKCKHIITITAHVRTYSIYIIYNCCADLGGLTKGTVHGMYVHMYLRMYVCICNTVIVYCLLPVFSVGLWYSELSC